jgi:FAD/FMN-containing dehydrogenase
MFENTALDNVSIVQEYFIPADRLVEFINAARTIMKTYKVNLLGLSIRYIQQDTESFLSHAPKHNAFACMFFINQSRTSTATDIQAQVSRALTDRAIENDGTYYLTYHWHQTMQQLRLAFPQIDMFFEKKRHYDPDDRFTSMFYEICCRG